MPKKTKTRKPAGRLDVRKSGVHGRGVYAMQFIREGTRIIEYTGEKINNRESLKREIEYLKGGHIWCFKLNRLYVRDGAVGGNVSRFINHACKPNCYVHIVGGVIWIRAARRIRKGEELCYDYNTTGDAEIPCQCRPGCQHML